MNLRAGEGRGKENRETPTLHPEEYFEVYLEYSTKRRRVCTCIGFRGDLW